MAPKAQTGRPATTSTKSPCKQDYHESANTAIVTTSKAEQQNGETKLKDKVVELETELKQLRCEKEALNARAVAAEDALSALRPQVQGRIQASAVRSKRFEPRITIYDTQDPVGGVRRIVRVEAPGRCLDGGSSATVSGEVQSIVNGVSICLNKLHDLPADALFCDPWLVDDPMGVWEWQYVPTDGAWELCESWGFEHGVFAFSMRQVPGGYPTNPVQHVVPPPLSLFRCKSPKGSKLSKCVSVIAPVSASLRQLSYFQCDTAFLDMHGQRIRASDVSAGMRLHGPQGLLEILQVSRDGSKHREVASISMDKEAVSVLTGSKVAVVAPADDGTTGADWFYSDVREVLAGSYDVVLCAPGSGATTVPVSSLALLGQMESAVVLEVNFEGTDGALLVVVERCFQGHSCRAKKTECTHPGSDFAPSGPFDYKSPQQQRRIMLERGKGWR